MAKLAVSTQLFGSQRLNETHVEQMARSGFRYVEVFAAPGHFEWQDGHHVRQVSAALRAAGLTVCSLHAPWAPGQDIATLEADRRAASQRAVEQAVDALVALGGRILVLHPGATVADPAAKAEQLALARQSVAQIAGCCAARGVSVALENPPPYELGGDNRDMLGLYDAFAQDATVQACFDTGHAHISPDGVGFVRRVSRKLLLVHLSDNAGQADDHLPPGRGTIDWERFFAQLGELRFDGYLVLELTDFPDADRILAESWEWLNRMAGSIA